MKIRGGREGEKTEKGEQRREEGYSFLYWPHVKNEREEDRENEEQWKEEWY